MIVTNSEAEYMRLGLKCWVAGILANVSTYNKQNQ